MSKVENAVVCNELIERKIYVIRGHKVMLDRDLAELYGVPAKRLNEQVSRNIERFPLDFMFRLNLKEFSNLRSQIATSSWGGQRYLPYAFTENGVAMLSGVLSSPRAIQVNIQIMRTFTHIRQLLASHQEVLKRLGQHDVLLAAHDQKIVRIFDVIQSLLDLPVTLKRRTGRIGFRAPGKE
jgi:hypothetical protein